MKQRRLNKSIILTALVMFFAVYLGNANFAQEIKRVNIGLIFGGNTEKPITVSSETGFVFGQEIEGSWMPILDLSIYPTLTFYKDGFYDKAGNQLSTGAMSFYLNGNVKGPFHIQVGDFYATYPEAFAKYMEISPSIPGTFLVYDNGWRVFTGSYNDSVESNVALESMKLQFPAQIFTLAEVNYGRVIVASGDQLIFAYDSGEPNLFFKTNLFELNKIKYRDSFIVKRNPNSDLTFINRLGLDEYLYGVVPKEMSGGWPIEALKAQAIAAKNFVLTASKRYASFGFDVCNTTVSQVYGGYSAEHPNSNQAVNEVSGMALSYNGAMIPLYYHSHSGGMTNNSENVWTESLPYIKQTFDPYSFGYPNTDWTISVSKAEIIQRLSVSGYAIGDLLQLKILERTEGGHVLSMEFVGTSGNVTLKKDKIRLVLGGSIIKSLLFSFDPSTAVTNKEAILQAAAGTNATPSVQNQETNPLMVPSVVRTNAGASAEFIDTNRLRVVINGIEQIVTMDKSALLSATDIYSTSLTSFKPYLYNNTEIFDTTGGSVVFYGHGYGHGLGMSQFGAKAMAEQGKSFVEILSFYYKDTALIQY